MLNIFFTLSTLLLLNFFSYATHNQTIQTAQAAFTQSTQSTNGDCDSRWSSCGGGNSWNDDSVRIPEGGVRGSVSGDSGADYQGGRGQSQYNYLRGSSVIQSSDEVSLTRRDRYRTQVIKESDRISTASAQGMDTLSARSRGIGEVCEPIDAVLSRAIGKPTQKEIQEMAESLGIENAPKEIRFVVSEIQKQLKKMMNDEYISPENSLGVLFFMNAVDEISEGSIKNIDHLKLRLMSSEAIQSEDAFYSYFEIYGFAGPRFHTKKVLEDRSTQYLLPPSLRSTSQLTPKALRNDVIEGVYKIDRKGMFDDVRFNHNVNTGLQSKLNLGRKFKLVSSIGSKVNTLS